MKTFYAGFTALISAIIISAVLLVIAVTGGLTGFFGRSNVLDSEFKHMSAAIAEACADHALLQLANSSTFYDVSGATTTISGNACYVSQATTAGPQKTFKARSYYKNFYTTLKVTIQTSDTSVILWQEISTY